MLAEHHPALHRMATARLKEPARFWDKLTGLTAIAEAMPAGAEKAIARLMPQSGLQWKVCNRRAGLGSLGRQRCVALAEWRGGLIAREAKALAPSAASWAEEGKGAAPILYKKIIESAVRCRDPYVRLQKRWIVRRLAPDCSRIELSRSQGSRRTAPATCDGLRDGQHPFTDSCAVKFKFCHVIEKRDGYRPEGLA